MAYRLTRRARRDVVEIWVHIAEHYEAAANRFVELLTHHFRLLGKHPYAPEPRRTAFRLSKFSGWPISRFLPPHGTGSPNHAWPPRHQHFARAVNWLRMAAAPKNIDEYIASFSPDIQAILQKIRLTIKQAAPDAGETISYKMPAFTLNGILVYFAAFKKHIGFYPPVRGDAKLDKSISPYAGEKGNLQFPLSQPIPYGLIETIVKLRVKQNLSKARASL